MNVGAIVTFLDTPLKALGWVDIRAATSFDPDLEVVDAPVALVFPGPCVPRGETRYDNFTAQITKDSFGVHIGALAAELDQRRDELQRTLLGKTFPGSVFDIQYEGGKPTTLGRDINWWADMYFTETDRRQQP